MKDFSTDFIWIMIISISFKHETLIDVVRKVDHIGGRWVIFRIDRFIVCWVNSIQWSRSWAIETISSYLPWRYMTRLNQIINQSVSIESIYGIAVRSMSAKTTRLSSYMRWCCWRMLWKHVPSISNVHIQHFDYLFWILRDFDSSLLSTIFSSNESRSILFINLIVFAEDTWAERKK